MSDTVAYKIVSAVTLKQTQCRSAVVLAIQYNTIQYISKWN